VFPIALMLAPQASAAPGPDPSSYYMSPHLYRAQPQVLITAPFVDYNAGVDYPPGVPWRLKPSVGEEGQFVAVRFDAANHLWVDEIAYYAPNTNENMVNCTVSRSRQMDLYVSASDTPPADAVPVRTITVPGNPFAPVGAIKFTVPISPSVFVPEGSSLFVALRLSGTVPRDVDCILQGNAAVSERVDTEFWSFATAPPFSWEGLDSLGIPYKVLMSISGSEALN
jgi:hypothetical protein